MDRDARQWCEHAERLSASQLFALMDFPLRAGLSEAHIFIDKSLSMQLPESEIFDQLTYDHDDQSIFRKEQSCVALCVLHQRGLDAATRENCHAFLQRLADGRLSLLNQAECGFLRVIRKLSAISRDPARRARLEQWLMAAPAPGALLPPAADRDAELALHNLKFTELKSLTDGELQAQLDTFLKIENAIDGEFATAGGGVSVAETQGASIDSYGLSGRHAVFRAIITSFSIALKDEPAAGPE
jgi:hypothetical protein